VKWQLALDRMSITQAVEMAKSAGPYADWIEVGTSLIKMYGMESVRAMKSAFPEKTIVADIKTFDNARYEFAMCFEAGADIATVMGAAPAKTVELCARTAEDYGKGYMIDLLNVPEDRIEQLCGFDGAILCFHLGKDQQEHEGTRFERVKAGAFKHAGDGLSVALAGGIRLEVLPELMLHRPDLIIVGEAVTKAPDPAAAAKQLSDFIKSRGDEC